MQKYENFKAYAANMKDKLLASAQKLIPPSEKAREELSSLKK